MRIITVWENGTWLEQDELTAEYAANDEDWLVNIPLQDSNDYIGLDAICVGCGKYALIVALDDNGLPICFDCATEGMPKERSDQGDTTGTQDSVCFG